MRNTQAPFVFFRGRDLIQIGADPLVSTGYVGLLNGRVLARSSDRPAVLRALLGNLGRYSGRPSANITKTTA